MSYDVTMNKIMSGLSTLSSCLSEPVTIHHSLKRKQVFRAEKETTSKHTHTST
jgi:hypothetical protein